MGLTRRSTGICSVSPGLAFQKENADDRTIALAGNPNVGKSTVFNKLTGMHQHTGNWPGKTVGSAHGALRYQNTNYTLVDLPGCYSLFAHSAEEEVSRDFICFGGHDGIIVVCDATCLERNLNLVLQTLEITDKVVVCVNLLDEARKKHIHLDLSALSARLGVAVVGSTARSGKGLSGLMTAVSEMNKKNAPEKGRFTVPYDPTLEEALNLLLPTVSSVACGGIDARWLCLRLLEHDPVFLSSISFHLGFDIAAHPAVSHALSVAHDRLAQSGVTHEMLADGIVSALVRAAEEIARGVITYELPAYDRKDRILDQLFTGKWTGFPIMLLLLTGIFWLTITGANVPSQVLSSLFHHLENHLLAFFGWCNVPILITEMLVFGVFRVLAWVISVMLPPMAIFFPLFTLLEDLGYLPRVAFNLDRCFKTCGACGKQALTMCMGFGCNAAGIVGCRIIDSPRERLIAMITNNFVPCNGRFPTLIAIITMFFAGTAATAEVSILSAFFLALVIVFGIFMTFVASKLLSSTLLKGVPSSFTLELPPYRRPQIGQVIIRSVLDRTLFVLGRAAAVAAPAGLIIWIAANITVGGATLLSHASGFLDPIGRLMGLDGVILLAFILGFPANEIVIPIMLMAYLSQGTLIEAESLFALKNILVGNGWTWVTAVSMMLFSLMHWPCSTACLTLQKETGSLKWTFIALALPTAIGFACCTVFTFFAKLV